MIKNESVLGLIIPLNIYLASGIALTGFSFALLLNKIPEMNLFLIVFLITFSLYSINRLTDKEEDAVNNPARVSVIKKFEKPLLAAAVLAYLLALFLGWVKNFETFLTVLLILIIGIIYSIKIDFLKGIIGHSRFKDILLGKNIAIATNWLLAMVAIPLVYYSSQINLAIIVLAVFIFFRSIINTVLFDLGDIKGDKKQGIRTIPIVLGPEKTIKVFYALNTLLGLLIFLAASYGILPPIAHVLNLSTLLVYAYLYLLEKPTTNKRKILDWIVDGEYLLIGASILLITAIL